MSDNSESILDRIMKGLIIVGIFGLLDLILFGAFGYAGEFVKSYIVGAFGYAAYGYSIAFTVVGLFVTFGFKPKVELKVVITYIAIVFFIVCIGQIATITNQISLGYVGALSDAFNNHDTLAGAAFIAFLYPFFLAKTFSIVFFSLILAGLVALVIVLQLNFDIGLKLRSNKKPQKTTYYSQDVQNYSSSDETTNTYSGPELYNGDVNGKLFDSNQGKPGLFTRYRKVDDVDMTPIDEVQPLQTMSEEEQDNILAGIDTDGNKIDEGEMKLTEQRAQQFSSASPFIPIVNETIEPEKKPEEEKKKIEITDSDRLYFNSKRRAILNGETQKETKQENVSDEYTGYDDIIIPDPTPIPLYSSQDDDVPAFLNESPIKEELDPFEAIMQNAVKEEETKEEIVEDKSETNYPFNSIEDVIKAHEEEEKQKQKEEREKLTSHYEVPKSIEPIKPIETPKPIIPEKPKEPEKPKRVYKKYNPPSIDMLDDFSDPIEDDSVLVERSEILKQTLANFKINVEIVGTIKGPTFSRINFRLEPGTPVKNLTSKFDDIKMGLAVPSMRLLAPVPGTSYCGVEIPNKVRAKVNLKTIYKSNEYQNAIKKDSGLIFALGQDINGKNFSYDLTTAPHMLVCGQTRSGKSVALNIMLISLLCRYSPEEMRLILFDPKQVEFEPYNGIPHLLIPQVLCDPPKAINAMKWAIDEMERRYELLKSTGTRNLEEYNSRPEIKRDPLKRVPYIVIVIDEFAEVVSQSTDLKKQFNLVIQRLAAKARAAGIHLVLATQRPSVDIVTGTIKSNLPTRVALKTTDAVNSGTILGCGGAEELLGYGDMLFMTPDSAELSRIQGAFISSPNVLDMLDYIKSNNDKYYDEEAEKLIMAEPQTQEPEQMTMVGVGEKAKGGIDPQFIDALEMCIESNRVSTSFLQMKMSIGFPRASKIIMWMEDNGYIKTEGNKKIIIATQADVDKLRAGGDEEEE